MNLRAVFEDPFLTLERLSPIELIEDIVIRVPCRLLANPCVLERSAFLIRTCHLPDTDVCVQKFQDGAGLQECRGSCRKKSQLSKSSSDEDDCVIGRSVQSYPRSREKQSFPDQTGRRQTTCLRRGGPIARLRNFVRALVGSRAPNTSSASPGRHARITVMDCCD